MMIIILQQVLVYSLSHVFLCILQIAFHSTDKSTMSNSYYFYYYFTCNWENSDLARSPNPKW